MDVEQGERPIGLGMVGEASLVGVGVDLLLDGFGLWGLSHVILSFLCYHSTLIIGFCQYPTAENLPENIVRFLQQMPCHGLQQRRLAVTLYGITT